MKVSIDNKFGFSKRFENELKKYLKKKFIEVIGMEAPILWVGSWPGMIIEYFESKKEHVFCNFCLTYNNSGFGVDVDLSWDSPTNYERMPYDEEFTGEINFNLQELDYFRERIRERLSYSNKHSYLPGYKFIVKVENISNEIVLKIEGGDKKEVLAFIDKKMLEWNEQNDTQFGGLFVHKGKYLKVGIDIGECEMKGLEFLLKSLSESSFEIEKISIL